uniref:Rubredoxin-like domain-containing protein n=1 Tax=Davidia involucrata TaxID=16924 RepID=A0A5B7BRL0_DAVIN
MALATTRPTFTFNLSTSLSQSSPPKPKSHLTLPLIFPKTHSISALHKHPRLKFTSKSIDVSKEDKPISEQPILEQPISEQPISATPSSEFPPPQEPEKFDKRRPEEKFAVLNTGIYECRSCGYLYNEAAGDPSYPIPPGMEFDKLPEDWRCSTCGAAKTFFVSKSVEIAGFAENQQFGLGGNALTSGQKAVLIYGSLLLAFVLFLSGYFLQ